MPSGRFTIGVEEEFCIVDAVTGELRPGAGLVLPQARRMLGHAVQPELNLSQVETETEVCRTLGEVRSELRRLRGSLVEAADAAGCRVLSAGTHPTAHWKDQQVNPTKERYRFLAEEFKLTARAQLVNGCHVHVGVDADVAIAVLDRVRPWLSPLLALSANSPFWMGVDSGYASYRTQVWAEWPLTGMPEPLTSRSSYDRLVGDLVRTGAIEDASFIYWDVRPSTRYPTLEFRIADACVTVDESVMVAGLARALVATAAQEADQDAPLRHARGEILEVAKWRAARYGLESKLVDVVACEERPAAHVVGHLLDHARVALEESGDWDEVHGLVQETLARGNGAMRQRAAYRASGELTPVLDLLTVGSSESTRT